MITKHLLRIFFLQAISDYKKLLKMQKNEKLDEERKELIQCEIKEIERFFHSGWANDLMKYLKIPYDSEIIIEKLRKDFQKTEVYPELRKEVE